MQPESIPLLNRIQKSALIVGVVGLMAVLAGAFISPQVFFQAYLLGYLFWVHLALGCLAGIMLHHLVGGRWSFASRRFFEASAMTLPLLALFFIPLLLGLPALYPWVNPEEVAHSELLQHKAVYLNVPFFIGRTVLYFVVWIGLAYLLNRWSHQQDQTGEAGPSKSKSAQPGLPNPGKTGDLAIPSEQKLDPLSLKNRLRAISPLGLILLVLTATFAAFDWMLSLEPEWFSSIYGVLFISGQALVAIAFALIMVKLFENQKPLADLVTVGVYNDLGNFLLAFVSFWAYIAFSQYLIIWSGNLPEEVTWYITRTQGGWQYVGLALIIFHFALPFAVLLSRAVKRQAQVLTVIAGFIVFMRLVDLFWLTMPALRPTLSLHWLDVVIPVAMGGFWVALFAWHLKRKSLAPLHDPVFQEVAVPHQEVAVHE
jgi:hypothetical protein